MMQDLINSAIDQFTMIRPADILDIILVAIIVYFLLKFIRDSHTIRLLKGIIFIIIACQFVYLLNLHVTSFIISACAQVGVIALVVIFQPELRRALDQVGKTSFFGRFSGDDKNVRMIATIHEVAQAAQAMGNTKTGALIVIEHGSDIDAMVSGGVKLDAAVSSELLENIFVHNTPLHDGAVIIRGNRIAYAACVLPLSQNPHITTELGTRHRAGIGISEESDVVVVIVSEETGLISIAHRGILNRGLNEKRVIEILTEILHTDAEEKSSHKPFLKRRDRQ